MKSTVSRTDWRGALTQFIVRRRLPFLAVWLGLICFLPMAFGQEAALPFRDQASADESTATTVSSGNAVIDAWLSIPSLAVDSEAAWEAFLYATGDRPDSDYVEWVRTEGIPASEGDDVDGQPLASPVKSAITGVSSGRADEIMTYLYLLYGKDTKLLFEANQLAGNVVVVADVPDWKIPFSGEPASMLVRASDGDYYRLIIDNGQNLTPLQMTQELMKQLLASLQDSKVRDKIVSLDPLFLDPATFGQKPNEAGALTELNGPNLNGPNGMGWGVLDLDKLSKLNPGKMIPITDPRIARAIGLMYVAAIFAEQGGYVVLVVGIPGPEDLIGAVALKAMQSKAAQLGLKMVRDASGKAWTLIRGDGKKVMADAVEQILEAGRKAFTRSKPDSGVLGKKSWRQAQRR